MSKILPESTTSIGDAIHTCALNGVYFATHLDRLERQKNREKHGQKDRRLEHVIDTHTHELARLPMSFVSLQTLQLIRTLKLIARWAGEKKKTNNQNYTFG